jgi:DNA-binding MarR family transcriptional regulator
VTGTAGPQPDAAARAWTAMRALIFDRYDRRAEVSEALQLSFIRAKAVRRLAAGPLTMRELAAAIGSDAPYTSVIVRDLEERGLVECRTGAADRRVKVVSVTGAGARSAAVADAILNEPPAELRALSPQDLQDLDRILGLLARG